MVSISIYNGQISERFLINQNEFHVYAYRESIHFYKGEISVAVFYCDTDSNFDPFRALDSIAQAGKITLIQNPKSKKIVGAQYV